MHPTGAVHLTKLGFSSPINLAFVPPPSSRALCPSAPDLFPPSQSKCWALEGSAHGRCHNSQSGAHSCHISPLEAVADPIRVRWARSPPPGPRQPCGPTLPPLLRTCQGHVSTLPNSEFLIMPNMMSRGRSGRTADAGRLGQPG